MQIDISQLITLDYIWKTIFSDLNQQKNAQNI